MTGNMALAGVARPTSNSTVTSTRDRSDEDADGSPRYQRGLGRPSSRLVPARLRGLSLRSRLLAMVIALDVFATLLTGTIIVLTARATTAVEIAASMHLADVLVADTIRLMQDVPAALVLETLDLHFQNIRHVRIIVTDDNGTVVRAQRSLEAHSDHEANAPVWFARLIAPAPDVKLFPLLIHNRRVGEVAVHAEPADEIGEAWQYAGAMMLAGLGLNMIVVAMLFFLFGRALRPLTALADGLQNLQGQNYGIRLQRPSLPELATIADHFNGTAVALAAAQNANRALNRKLVTAQDDERRRTALELHDEVGPCLFALDVNITSMAALADRLDGGEDLGDLASETASLVKQVQGINRRVLDRLRPMSLGRIPLADCLLDLVAELTQDRAPVLRQDIGPLDPSYGPLVDLTIYRCLQEGLFNAIRHAEAKSIEVCLKPHVSGRRLDLSVKDDGRGLSGQAKAGVGLAGMQERTEALGGHFDFIPSARGSVLMISIPLGAAPLASAACQLRTV